MPNAPLHNTSTRPPDGIRGPRCLGYLWTAERKTKAETKASRASPLLQARRTFVGWVERSDTHLAGNQTTSGLRFNIGLSSAPYPRSGGRVESLRKGASRMDAARGVKGQGRPLYAGPWSNDGTREVERSETRMSGACFFCLLFFARAKKSKAPEGAQHARSNTTDAADKR